MYIKYFTKSLQLLQLTRSHQQCKHSQTLSNTSNRRQKKARNCTRVKNVRAANKTKGDRSSEFEERNVQWNEKKFGPTLGQSTALLQASANRKKIIGTWLFFTRSAGIPGSLKFREFSKLTFEPAAQRSKYDAPDRRLRKNGEPVSASRISRITLNIWRLLEQLIGNYANNNARYVFYAFIACWFIRA